MHQTTAAAAAAVAIVVVVVAAADNRRTVPRIKFLIGWWKYFHLSVWSLIID
jgi:hypothetical protein